MKCQYRLFCNPYLPNLHDFCLGGLKDCWFCINFVCINRDFCFRISAAQFFHNLTSNLKLHSKEEQHVYSLFTQDFTNSACSHEILLLNSFKRSVSAFSVTFLNVSWRGAGLSHAGQWQVVRRHPFTNLLYWQHSVVVLLNCLVFLCLLILHGDHFSIWEDAETIFYIFFFCTFVKHHLLFNVRLLRFNKRESKIFCFLLKPQPKEGDYMKRTFLLNTD